jgi:hypothetical protein
MSEKENTITEYEELLRQQELRLIELKSGVWTFLDTEHTLADVKKVQSQVRVAELDVGAINRGLLTEKKLWMKYKTEADELHQRCADLLNYTKDMSNALDKDYADLRRTVDNEKFDALKEIGTFFAIPGALIGYVKARGGNSITVDEAATVGILISIPFAARKKLSGAFKAAAKTICDTPRELKNSFMLYYLKESVKEHGRAAVKLLGRRTKVTPPGP